MAERPAPIAGVAPGDADGHSSADRELLPRFDLVPGTGQQPATVRAAGENGPITTMLKIVGLHEFSTVITAH